MSLIDIVIVTFLKYVVGRVWRYMYRNLLRYCVIIIAKPIDKYLSYLHGF